MGRHLVEGGSECFGPVIPFVAMVEYHPISAGDHQSRLHQCGKKVWPGIFLGYAMHWMPAVCSNIRSETRSCRITWITSATCSNTLCGTGMSTISGTELRLWDFRGPLDLLYHWHLSLILSCLGGWYLALHQLSMLWACGTSTVFCAATGRLTILSTILSVCWTCGSCTVCCTSESQAPVAYHHGHVCQLRLWYLDSLPDLLDERHCLCIMVSSP